MRPILCSFFLAVLTTAAAADSVRLPEAGARKFVLPNGLEIIVKEDRSAPVVSVQAWCRVGSIHEDGWLGAGLSHILEHMLFKGTETRKTSEIATAVQDAGGYINAYTSLDQTVYWIDIPKEGTNTALDILADITQHATFPEDEYVREQEVIRREFAMGFDDPKRVGSKLLFKSVFRGHPYRHPVIGYLDIFNKLTREDVIAFYRKHYVPNNMFFVVVGDVDAEDVRDHLAASFKDARRTSVRPIFIPREPPQLGRRERHIEFATELTRLNLAWRAPELTHPDVPALDVLAYVLGEGMSSRLYRELRESRGLVHGIDAYSYTPAYPGIFAVTAVVDPGNRQAAVEAVLAEVEKVKKSGVTGNEVKKAQRLTLSVLITQLRTMRGQARDLGSNWLVAGNLDFTREYIESLNRVTPEDVRRVARRYLVDRSLTITSLNPMGSLDPQADEKPAESTAKLQKFTLKNGLTLLVREDPRLPLVSLRATFRGGVLAEDAKTNGLSRLFTSMLLKGTRGRSGEEIAQAVEQVGGSIGSQSGYNSFGIAVEVLQPDTELGLDILSDVLLHASFPEAGLAREKAVQRAAIKAEDDQMMAVAGRILRRTTFGDRPYSRTANGTVESLEGLSRGDLVEFGGEFLCAKNGVLAVFGSVKAEEVRELVEKKLAALPPGKPAFQDLQTSLMPKESSVVEENRDKAQAVLMFGFGIGAIGGEDYPAVELIDEACSDMASRLFLRIREELGLAYYVGTTRMAGPAPGAFIFYVGTSPDKSDLVEKEMIGQIERLAKDGLTATELARAKRTYLARLQIAGQSNLTLSQSTSLDELFGLGHDRFLRISKIINAVTLEQVKEAARKYFLNQPRVTARVRPAKAAKSAE